MKKIYKNGRHWPMDKINNDSQNDIFAGTCSSITDRMIDIAILVLMTVFPLIYHHSYFDILETKYLCYWLCVVILLSCLLIFSLIAMFIDKKEFGGLHTKRLLSGLLPKNWGKTFRTADVAILAFLLITVISTLQSDYFYESFWGNEGRFSGLFLLTLYVSFYFVVSRFWTPKKWWTEAFLASGMIVCYIGITDYFQLDILDFRHNIDPAQSTIFTSTMGNINTYTAYVGLIMALAAGLFSREDNPWKMAWYYVCLIVSFTAIIMGCSDNAYLSIGALFGLLPLILFKNRRGFLRYLVLISSFFTVVQAIDLINGKYADMVIGLDSLFGIITNFRGLLPTVVFLWMMVIGCWFFSHTQNKKTPIGENPQAPFGVFGKITLVRLWTLLLLAVVIALCFAFYDANSGGNAARYGALRSYLVFDDLWGSCRGYIWKASVRLYKEFPLMHKIFGYGPDTFGILTDNAIYVEMREATGQYYDTAHNAYLQYLVTIGPFGLAAYLFFLVNSCWRIFNHCEKSPYIFGALMAAVCYLIQATVNLDLPIATPVMWLMISIGIAGCREEPAQK